MSNIDGTGISPHGPSTLRHPQTLAFSARISGFWATAKKEKDE
jgi:hypothetical protein